MKITNNIPEEKTGVRGLDCSKSGLPFANDIKQVVRGKKREN